jgi:purine-cytosine permease-like protein
MFTRTRRIAVTLGTCLLIALGLMSASAVGAPAPDPDARAVGV